MRKSLITLAAIATGLSSLSMYRNLATDLLDGHDYEQMRVDVSRGSALSGPLVNGSPTWASYNQWLCFPARDVEIACAEDEYDREIRKVPVLHTTEGSHYFEFSMDAEPAPDCDKITERWKALLQDEGAFCAYAAPLQELNISAYDTQAEAGSLWIINQLKTSKGYWRFESDENWLRQDEDGASTESGSESVGDDPEI